MCFSAEASFAAAGVLVPMGVYCVRASARRLPRYWGFAVMPLAFAAQQAAEGVVWLGLTHNNSDWVPLAVAAYLFFALAWWPFWFPFSAAVAAQGPPTQRGSPKERLARRGRENRTRRLLAIWAALSTGWFFLAYLPVLLDSSRLWAEISHHSIRYPFADGVVVGGATRWPVTMLYGLCVAGPMLLFAQRELLPLVVMGWAGVAIAGLVYAHAYTSVWCFFASLLSAYCVYFFATAPSDEPGDSRG